MRIAATVLFFAWTTAVFGRKLAIVDRKCTTSDDCPSLNRCKFIGRDEVAKMGVCVPIDCGPPPFPENGVACAPTGTLPGHRALLGCDDGFLLIGDPMLNCTDTGEWSSGGECLPDGCGEPPVPENGYTCPLNNTGIGQEAYFGCDPGYKRGGPGSTSCLETGEWNTNTTCIVSTCGEVLSDGDNVTSPNFPNLYNTYDDCIWLITVPEGNAVTLSFQSLEIEYCGEECGCDSLEVFDGSSECAISLGNYCGTQLPPIIRSSSNQLLIRFRSDSSIEGSGFSATATQAMV